MTISNLKCSLKEVRFEVPKQSFSPEFFLHCLEEIQFERFVVFTDQRHLFSMENPTELIFNQTTSERKTSDFFEIPKLKHLTSLQFLHFGNLRDLTSFDRLVNLKEIKLTLPQESFTFENIKTILKRNCLRRLELIHPFSWLLLQDKQLTLTIQKQTIQKGEISQIILSFRDVPIERLAFEYDGEMSESLKISISNLKELKYLYLCFNEFSGFEKSFKELDNLKCLIFDGPDSFCHFAILSFCHFAFQQFFERKGRDSLRLRSVHYLNESFKVFESDAKVFNGSSVVEARLGDLSLIIRPDSNVDNDIDVDRKINNCDDKDIDFDVLRKVRGEFTVFKKPNVFAWKWMMPHVQDLARQNGLFTNKKNA